MDILCDNCSGECTKNGKQSNGKQRWVCKLCKKTKQSNYTYKACLTEVKTLVFRCLKSGSGLRDVLRITGVAVSTQIIEGMSLAK